MSTPLPPPFLPCSLLLFDFSTPADIKRLMAYAPAMNSEFIVSYFGTLSRETSIDVMREMLGKNMRQNLQMVVQIATNYSDQIGAQSLIDMFEGFKLYEGLFYYLGAIVNNSTVRVFTQSMGAVRAPIMLALACFYLIKRNTSSL